jgi:hypothetical protein
MRLSTRRASTPQDIRQTSKSHETFYLSHKFIFILRLGMGHLGCETSRRVVVRLSSEIAVGSMLDFLLVICWICFLLELRPTLNAH